MHQTKQHGVPGIQELLRDLIRILVLMRHEMGTMSNDQGDMSRI